MFAAAPDPRACKRSCRERSLTETLSPFDNESMTLGWDWCRRSVVCLLGAALALVGPRCAAAQDAGLARVRVLDALSAAIRAEEAAERAPENDAVLIERDQKRQLYREARRQFEAAMELRTRVRRTALDRFAVISAMAVDEANRVRALRTIAAGIDAGHGSALRRHLRRLRGLIRALDSPQALAEFSTRLAQAEDEPARLLRTAIAALDQEADGATPPLRAWLGPYRYLLEAARAFSRRPETLESPLRPLDRARLADTPGLVALLANVPGLKESERLRLEAALIRELPTDPIDEDAAGGNLRALQVAALRETEIQSDRPENWGLPQPGGPFGRIVPYPRISVGARAYARGQRVLVTVVASDTYASDATLYLVPAESPRGDARATERNSMEARLIGAVYSRRVFFTAPAAPGRYAIRLWNTQRPGRAREVASSPSFSVR